MESSMVSMDDPVVLPGADRWKKPAAIVAVLLLAAAGWLGWWWYDATTGPVRQAAALMSDLRTGNVAGVQARMSRGLVLDNEVDHAPELVRHPILGRQTSFVFQGVSTINSMAHVEGYAIVGNAAVPMRITIEKRDGEWMVLNIELPDEVVSR